jgi:hypothetical protein
MTGAENLAHHRDLIPVLSIPLRVAISAHTGIQLNVQSINYQMMTQQPTILYDKDAPSKKFETAITRTNDASPLNNQYTIFTNMRDIG